MPASVLLIIIVAWRLSHLQLRCSTHFVYHDCHMSVSCRCPRSSRISSFLNCRLKYQSPRRRQSRHVALYHTVCEIIIKVRLYLTNALLPLGQVYSVMTHPTIIAARACTLVSSMLRYDHGRRQATMLAFYYFSHGHVAKPTALLVSSTPLAAIVAGIWRNSPPFQSHSFESI